MLCRVARLSVRQPLPDRRVVLKIAAVTLIALLVWSILVTSTGEKAKQCFRRPVDIGPAAAPSIAYFPDLLRSARRPKMGKTIFFHETSCSGDGFVRLNARQACAIESAAKLNPDWDVFVLFASPRGLYNDSAEPIPPPIAALQTYPNIFLRNIDLWSYAADTPMERWLARGHLFSSLYLNSHVSDFLRYLTLYRYGGTYMDLDVVVQRNLSAIAPNYAGAESPSFVAAGVINLDHNGIGHVIAELCVREFTDTFDGSDWGNNGPGVITRVLQKICHVEETPHMSEQHCLGFKVYPPSAFYPITWTHWRYYFEPKHLPEAMALTNKSIAIHVWNNHSAKEKYKVGTQAAYGVIADQMCPFAYWSGEYF